MPEEVDETVEAPTADLCECGGEIELEKVVSPWQEELPEPRPIRREIRVLSAAAAVAGAGIGAVTRSRPPMRLGAAASMLGPRAVALAAQLNRELGLSPQKAARALSQFGIRVTPGGVVQAIARQARALQPTYEALRLAVRSSAVVAPDETGWRVAARKQWLWAFVGDDQLTVYLIAGRGYEDAKLILGEEFAGVLERRVGALPQLQARPASDLLCAPAKARWRGLIEDSIAGQARVPHAVRRLLKDAVTLREQRDRQTNDSDEVIDAEEFGLRVEQRADELLEIKATHEPNRRPLAHVSTERQHMFTFLKAPDVQATNWRAKQPLRPAIVNRTSWGGNRSWAGADTQVITMSVLRTARQNNWTRSN